MGSQPTNTGTALPEIGGVLAASSLAAESAAVAGIAATLEGVSGVVLGASVAGVGALAKVTLAEARQLNKEMFILFGLNKSV